MNDYFQIQFIIWKILGFEILKKTFDLENEDDFWENIQTEHEKMFMEQGIKIKGLIAKKIDPQGRRIWGKRLISRGHYLRRNMYEQK